MDVDLILTEAIASYQRGEEEPNAKLANRKASAAVNDVDELGTKLEEIKAPSFYGCFTNTDYAGRRCFFDLETGKIKLDMKAIYK